MRDYCWAIEKGTKGVMFPEDVSLDEIQKALEDAIDEAEYGLYLLDWGLQKETISQELAKELKTSFTAILNELSPPSDKK